jgi:hypothetical protein
VLGKLLLNLLLQPTILAQIVGSRAESNLREPQLVNVLRGMEIINR